jgi:SNF family Na+-dependent transporter
LWLFCQVWCQKLILHSPLWVSVTKSDLKIRQEGIFFTNNITAAVLVAYYYSITSWNCDFQWLTGKNFTYPGGSVSKFNNQKLSNLQTVSIIHLIFVLISDSINSLYQQAVWWISDTEP